MTMVVSGVRSVATLIRAIPLHLVPKALGILKSGGLKALVAWAVIELGIQAAEWVYDVSELDAAKMLKRKRRRRRKLLPADVKKALVFVDSNFEGKLAQSMRAMILQKAT